MVTVDSVGRAMSDARYLNTLPQSHWDAWYADERRMNALLDKHTAAGLSPEAAYDAAIAERNQPCSQP